MDSCRCDGIDDCPLKDDELLCTDCEVSEYTCENQKCIPHAWVCDRVNDCGDKSDEKDCDSKTTEKSEIEAIHCEEYKCLTGSCIPYTSVCNGVADCFDQSDEDGKCGKHKK